MRETAEAIRTGVDECVELGVIRASVGYLVSGAAGDLRRANPAPSVEVKVLDTLELAAPMTDAKAGRKTERADWENPVQAQLEVTIATYGQDPS